MDSFIRENLVLPVMYDSVHSVLVKQHGYIQWTNCTKNTLLGNSIPFFKSVKLAFCFDDVTSNWKLIIIRDGGEA